MHPSKVASANADGVDVGVPNETKEVKSLQEEP
jgi:hypothetical protein